jgi:low affinity Fe/Cu permease
MDQKLQELLKRGRETKEELFVIKNCVANAIQLQKQALEREIVLQATLTQLAIEIDAIESSGELRQLKKAICRELFADPQELIVYSKK